MEKKPPILRLFITCLCLTPGTLWTKEEQLFLSNAIQLPSLIAQTYGVCPFWISPIDSPVTCIIMSDYFMIALSSLLSVMHESSKRVSETLQEIYSSKWDGHEELKAIVAVRVCWALQSSTPYPHLSLIPASLSKQTGEQRSQFTLFICIAVVTGGRKEL